MIKGDVIIGESDCPGRLDDDVLFTTAPLENRPPALWPRFRVEGLGLSYISWRAP